MTDIAFVRGPDQFTLLARTPDLLAINTLITALAAEHGVVFQRATATIRANVPNASEVVREWLLQPLPHSTTKKDGRAVR